jgi:GntR family transcriptional regulator, transcriptional repressor for pyruvate dehydrogenase complex
MSMVEAFSPVVKVTLTERVAQRLMEHIQSGRLQPGDALPSQYKLAQMFGVSRPILREAMQGLVSIGLLEIRPGSGCYVGSPRVRPDSEALFEILTHEAALETLEARMVVEVELAGLASQRGDERDWHALEAILDRLRVASDTGTETVTITSDFHSALSRAGHNSVLYKMSQLLSRARVSQGVRIEQALPDIKAGEYGSHLRLYTAVRSGDPQEARLEMRRHLEIAHGWEERVSSLRTRIAAGSAAEATIR